MIFLVTLFCNCHNLDLRYVSPDPFQWAKVMKEVLSQIRQRKFVESGAWDMWFGGAEGEDAVSESSADEGSEYKESGTESASEEEEAFANEDS